MNSKIPKLNKTDIRVFEALGMGIENAKTRTELCAELKLCDSSLRASIMHLRKNRLLIGAKQTGGYYICKTPEECEELIRMMKQKGYSLINTIRADEKAFKGMLYEGNNLFAQV